MGESVGRGIHPPTEGGDEYKWPVEHNIQCIMNIVLKSILNKCMPIYV